MQLACPTPFFRGARSQRKPIAANPRGSKPPASGGRDSECNRGRDRFPITFSITLAPERSSQRLKRDRKTKRVKPSALEFICQQTRGDDRRHGEADQSLPMPGTEPMPGIEKGRTSKTRWHPRLPPNPALSLHDERFSIRPSDRFIRRW
ncbi:hypothetical protein Pla52o_34610 [Novipirellula galeiformis]|uniref:Uncharacterized protein n=1 Tax=Novipirellula galeiformis TaxID=2528004 RepID=A0A5C6CEF9_9BACT|nr:hypothetical protein Pla52o_34610 [Novipirellula galeiformis]